MRLAIDLQGLHSLVERELLPTLAVARAALAESGTEVLFVLAAHPPGVVDSVRALLHERLPACRVLVFDVSAALAASPASAGLRVARALWHAGLERLEPDLVWVCQEPRAGREEDALSVGGPATRWALAVSVDRVAAHERGPDAAPLESPELQRLLTGLSRADLLIVPDAGRRELLAARLPIDASRLAVAEAGDDARAGRAIWDALRRVAGAGAASAPALPGDAPVPRRLRLAVVSPLPPERTGVADTCAVLLPALARWYDIDVVAPQPGTDDPWASANCGFRDLAWFDAHAHRYDRIVYHMGNSLFHEHVFALLERHGGTVVLHDLALSDLLDHRERAGRESHAFTRALYHSHGYAALADVRRRGRTQALRAWPCSRAVIEASDGAIVTSRFAARWAEQLWGPALPLQAIPLPCASIGALPRDGARERLGLPADAFVVCTFGALDASKLNHRLADAWRASALAPDTRARLVFVGDCTDPQYARRLRGDGDGDGDCAAITGYASPDRYRDWLAAADVAVQLRTGTRGESSGALLDCLAHGLPTIVNAHGAMREVGEHATWMLPDAFDDRQLVHALESLHAQPQERRRLGEAARALVRERHDPVVVARAHAQAIERFHREGRPARLRRLAAAVADALEPGHASRDATHAIALSIARNDPPPGLPQLLVDVTALALHDLGSGIQRVVRSVLMLLLERGVCGLRVEPVYLNHGSYWYARRFASRLLDAPEGALEDAPVLAVAGDVFFGLDLVTDGVHQHEPVFAFWRTLGVRVFFLVHDLLPERRPEWFLPEAVAHFRGWLHTVARVADGFVCNSRSTADDLARWLADADQPRARPPAVRWFHLGADIPSSLPSAGVDPAGAALLERLQGRCGFLMVGTVEPRKGYAQALDAFERLWAEGADVDLVIVGRAGWMVEALVARMRAHPQRLQRLFWIEDASDELLMRLYASACALVVASEGEGFGLPIVEAASHGLPVIVRDLPVFREVAGETALFWDGGIAGESGARGLTAALRQWLARREAGEAGREQARSWLSWEASTQELLRELLGPDARLGEGSHAFTGSREQEPGR